MRNVKKTLLIVSVALIAGGAVLAGGAWAAAGFDFAKLSTHVNKFDRQTKTLEAESTAPHKAIRVESEFGDVKLVPADGDAIELVYWTNVNRTADVKDENGVLTLSFKETESIGSIEINLMDKGQDDTTVVRVPKSFTGDISVSNDFASTTATDLEGISSCTLVSSSGEVWASDVSAKTLDATSNDGVVMLNNVAADTLRAQSDNGEVGVIGCSSKDASVTSENGKVTVKESTFNQASVRADNGTIALAHLACAKLVVAADNGTITGRELDVADGEYTSNNGMITLGYVGSSSAYVIDAASANGTVTAPASNLGATRIVRALSDNGIITIEFEEDK